MKNTNRDLISSHALERANLLIHGMVSPEVIEEMGLYGVDMGFGRREFLANERKFLLYWSSPYKKSIVSVVGRNSGIIVTCLEAWTKKGGALLFLADAFGFRDEKKLMSLGQWL